MKIEVLEEDNLRSKRHFNEEIEYKTMEINDLEK